MLGDLELGSYLHGFIHLSVIKIREDDCRRGRSQRGWTFRFEKTGIICMGQETLFAQEVVVR